MVKTGEELEVEKVVFEGLRSIENLDWNKFVENIHENVTMFHTDFGDHLYDSKEFFQIWRRKFDSWIEVAEKKGMTPSYPEPKDLRIDFPSECVAIATFSTSVWGRRDLRTFVFKHDDGVWKLIHLHGSFIK